MIKKLLALSAIAFALSPGTARAVDNNSVYSPDVVGYTQYKNNATTSIWRTDFNGNVIPGRNLVQDLGESSHSWNNVYAGVVQPSSGLVNVHDVFVNLSSGNALGMLPAGVFYGLSTATLLNGGTTFTAIGKNIVQATGAPRNIIIELSTSVNNPSQSAVSFSTTQLSGSATFYGIDGKGNYAQETIYFSTLTISWSTTTVVQSTNPALYMGVGNVAWAYISSFTVQITSMTDQFGLMTSSPILMLGWGNKIGLSDNIISSTPVTGFTNYGDVYMISEDGGLNTNDVNSFPAVSVNPQFDWISFNTQPNGLNRKEVWYRVRRMWP